MQSVRQPIFMTVLMAGLIAGCGGEHDSNDNHDADGGGGPAAPSDLDGMVMGSGIHLTWTDNSNDEEAFHLERKDDDGAFVTIYETPFDIEQYHDGGLTSGVTYSYRISAMNGEGMSDPSSVFTLQMP